MESFQAGNNDLHQAGTNKLHVNATKSINRSRKKPPTLKQTPSIYIDRINLRSNDCEMLCHNVARIDVSSKDCKTPPPKYLDATFVGATVVVVVREAVHIVRKSLSIDIRRVRLALQITIR